MGIDIQWDRLAPVNPLGSVLQGYEVGSEAKKKRVTTNALSNYDTNPEQAISDLMSVDAEMGMKLKGDYREQQAQRQRQATFGKYAEGDSAGARKDALMAGDVDLVKVIQGLDEDATKQAMARAERQAALIVPLMDVPYAERKARIMQIAPQLEEAGYSPEQIQNFDPTDANLNTITGQVLGIRGQLEQRWKAQDFGLKKDQFAETQRHNRAGEAVSAGNLGVSRANLAQRRAEHAARQRGEGGYAAPGAGAGLRILGPTLDPNDGWPSDAR